MPGSECRHCGAKLIWAETAKGKRMPLDPTPAQDLRAHGVQVVFEGIGGRAQCRPFDEAVREIAERRRISTMDAFDIVETCEGFVSHFASCPGASDFRGGRIKR